MKQTTDQQATCGQSQISCLTINSKTKASPNGRLFNQSLKSMHLGIKMFKDFSIMTSAVISDHLYDHWLFVRVISTIMDSSLFNGVTNFTFILLISKMPICCKSTKLPHQVTKVQCYNIGRCFIFNHLKYVNFQRNVCLQEKMLNMIFFENFNLKKI